tara:strand:- start:85 stop:969 length:885 start_codon:yes stop_codon:yes gene_type:complete
MLVATPENFKASENVLFTKPKVNASGGKSCGILNSITKKSLYLSTPLIKCWGVNKRENERMGGFNYDFSLQFDDENFASEKQKEFLNTLTEFENFIRKSAIEHSKEWLGKAKMSEEVLDALWTPMLKYPKDKETDEPDMTRPPTLKVKMPVWEGNFKFELYDVEHNLLLPNNEDPSIGPEDLVEKLSSIACILQCGGLWFASGKFGVTWKLVQAVVKPSVSFKMGTCQISLDNNEVNKLNSETPKDNNNAYDSDGEEVEEEEEEEEQQQVEEVEEVVAPKKKKGGRKKVVANEE